jgi:hypothetical protein
MSDLWGRCGRFWFCRGLAHGTFRLFLKPVQDTDQPTGQIIVIGWLFSAKTALIVEAKQI